MIVRNWYRALFASMAAIPGSDSQVTGVLYSAIISRIATPMMVHEKYE
jgi:hypothetical protein